MQRLLKQGFLYQSNFRFNKASFISPVLCKQPFFSSIELLFSNTISSIQGPRQIEIACIMCKKMSVSIQFMTIYSKLL